MTTAWTCPNCHHEATLEPVEVWRKGEARWENSSVRECSRCKKPFGGTLSDRLAVIQTVYDRVSLDPLPVYSTQARALWEAKFLADIVPELLEALKAAERFIYERSGGGETDFREKVLLPAIAKVESCGAPETDTQ